MPPKLIFTILLICVLTSACNSAPYADELTANKPEVADITGVYKFEKETVRDNGDDKPYKDATISIKSDGTYAVTDIPNLVDDGYDHHHPISVTGKWTMQTVGHFDNVWGQKLRRWGIYLNKAPEGFERVGFMGKSAPYKLIVDFNDPTLDKVFIFGKK